MNPLKWEAVIGLEVHVQLKTRTKVFCGCSTEFGMEPNSQVCPVCLGFPGSLPVLNELALESSIKVGLALDCTVQEFTKFDRKHYYYPDLPKNFQISQYDLPISKDGHLDITVNAQPRRIGVRRAHLEEDAGKLIHKDEKSLVDLNRTGMPLLEIVSEPDMHTPEEAYEYLTSLKSIIQYLGVSDCDMEKGTLRCDANISIRPAGSSGLGTKSELKNLNSFKAVRDALGYEIERHIETLEAGEKIVQETRLWDDKAGRTVSMRSKEEAKDYRYFPEPDLPPFVISAGRISQLRSQLPELPQAKARRFCSEFGLSEKDSAILTGLKANADFAEERIRAFPGANKKPVVNWLIGPLFSEANQRGCELHQLAVSSKQLSELIDLVEQGAISNLAAKTVLTDMLGSGKSPSQIVKEKNLAQVSDASSLNSDIEAVLCQHPGPVGDFKAGKTNALMFLVGQVMKMSKGKTNPKVVQELLKERLSHG